MDAAAKPYRDAAERDHHKFVVIADDFTGSNDCGVQLKNCGLSTVTILDKAYINDIYGYDAVVIDSETRSMTKEDAYEKMLEIGAGIKTLVGRNTVFKKIDSTLRGNIGSEIEALDCALDPELVVFAPAYPRHNRITVRGIHYLNGVPIDKTELSKDPKNPVLTSDMQEILRSDAGMDFMHVGIESVRNDEIGAILRKSAGKYFSFDAQADEDLVRIVKQVLSLGKTVLWVGSAGLTDAVVNAIAPVEKKRAPVLAVVGSINSISAGQAQEAMKDKRVFGLKIDIESVVMHPERERDRIQAAAMQQMDAGSDVLLATALESDQIIAASCLSRDLGLTLSEISSRVADFMGAVAYGILRSRQLSGMVLTGGDTAFHVINRLSAKGSVLVREVETGVPLVSLLGGPYEGLPVVTKAGAFGKPETIRNAMEYLRSRHREPDNGI